MERKKIISNYPEYLNTNYFIALCRLEKAADKHNMNETNLVAEASENTKFTKLMNTGKYGTQ